jgi:hypothetical protein
MPNITYGGRDGLLEVAAELEAEARYRERLQPHVSGNLGAERVRRQAEALRDRADRMPRP